MGADFFPKENKKERKREDLRGREREIAVVKTKKMKKKTRTGRPGQKFSDFSWLENENE